jgi:hypothetical protein
MARFRRSSRITECPWSCRVVALAAILPAFVWTPRAGAVSEDAEPASPAAAAQAATPQPPFPMPPTGSRRSSPDETADPSGEKTPLPVSGPRDLLRRYGVDDSQFDRLRDGRPVGDDENELLLKVMFWLRSFSLASIERWARDDWTLAELVKQCEANRGQIFPLVGRVTLVEVRRPVPEVVDRFELERYYRAEFVLADGQPAVVFTRNVPKPWQEGAEVDARAGAKGMFLKLAGADRDRPVPVFVAPRIAWHPENLLGNLGMDVGLFDHVENRKGLTGHDREAFYQMLAAVGRAKPGQLLRQADQELKEADQTLKRTDEDGNEYCSVVPLFNDAENQHGRLVVLSGTARRTVRIVVKDADVTERFGIKHYYEMAVFTDDSDGNPLVFCVRELPKGMPTGDGPRYGEHVRVAGFFFKTWGYRVQQADRSPQSGQGPGFRRQLAPLLIGRQPTWYPQRAPVTSPMAATIAGGLFVLVLLGIWLAVWRYGRSDKQFHEQTIAKAYAVHSGVSLNDLELNADAAPDFSGLDKTDRDTDARDDA